MDKQSLLSVALCWRGEIVISSTARQYPVTYTSFFSVLTPPTPNYITFQISHICVSKMRITKERHAELQQQKSCSNDSLKTSDNKPFFLQRSDIFKCRSQWPRSLRHEPSSPARTLGSWVLIPLEA
jgi:hypothetical protein